MKNKKTEELFGKPERVDEVGHSDSDYGELFKLLAGKEDSSGEDEQEETEKRTLRDVINFDFISEFSDEASKYLDVEVVEEMDGCKIGWPGTHKNVFVWWKLANGKAVAWNENPARGYSFPVITLKKKS